MMISLNHTTFMGAQFPGRDYSPTTAPSATATTAAAPTFTPANAAKGAALLDWLWLAAEPAAVVVVPDEPLGAVDVADPELIPMPETVVEVTEVIEEGVDKGDAVDAIDDVVDVSMIDEEGGREMGGEGVWTVSDELTLGGTGEEDALDDPMNAGGKNVTSAGVLVLHGGI